MTAKRITLGVISDTHGLLRPEAVEALRGTDGILHAGDVGAPEILEALAMIAPVTAVRGNVDTASWARALPETEVVEAGGLLIYILHDLGQLDLKPPDSGWSYTDIAISRRWKKKMACSISIQAALAHAVSNCQ